MNDFQPIGTPLSSIVTPGPRTPQPCAVAAKAGRLELPLGTQKSQNSGLLSTSNNPRSHEEPSPPRLRLTNMDRAQPRKRTRTRTGCLNCRRKKRKCDEGRPACGTCYRRNEHCEWGLKITFRAENAQSLESRHPSMRRMARKRPPREFEILDITSEVIRDYNAPSPLLESDDEEADAKERGNGE